MAFGVTLAELRLKTGKSRYRLAESTGIDQTYIQRLENGKKTTPPAIWC